MLKKLMTLLTALLLCLPALAETAEPMATPEPAPTAAPEEILSPYEIALPAGLTVTLAASGASVTYTDAAQRTRVVGMTLERVPDPEGDHAAELERLMGQYAPDAAGRTPLTLAPGCYGLMANSPASLPGVNGTQVDQVIVMVLWQTPERGALLILTGYDLTGDTDRAAAMVGLLLQNTAVQGVSVIPAPTGEASTAP